MRENIAPRRVSLASEEVQLSAPTRSAVGCITIPLLALAVVPLAWGARSRWADGVLLRNGVTVQGRVVELRHVPSNPSIRRARRGPSGTPIVEFQTREGQARTMIGSMNRRPADFEVGDSAEVVYDPADPERADVKVELERWAFWCVIWSALGAVLAAVAFLPFVVARRARPLRPGA